MKNKLFTSALLLSTLLGSLFNIYGMSEVIENYNKYTAPYLTTESIPAGGEFRTLREKCMADEFVQTLLSRGGGTRSIRFLKVLANICNQINTQNLEMPNTEGNTSSNLLLNKAAENIERDLRENIIKLNHTDIKIYMTNTSKFLLDLIKEKDDATQQLSKVNEEKKNLTTTIREISTKNNIRVFCGLTIGALIGTGLGAYFAPTLLNYYALVHKIFR